MAGQVHGSVTMGVGQAMLEQTVYDDGGQLVSALVHGLRDAARPHISPVFKDDVHEVPATTNPLGVKGAGEAGTTAAIAAVMNAFADAIPGAGHKIQMPATPAKVWKACREMAARLELVRSHRGRSYDNQFTVPVLMSCIAAAMRSCLASTMALMIGLRLRTFAAVKRALASATF